VTDTVDVWLIDSALPGDVHAGLLAVLDEQELERTAALATGTDRERFVAAHGAARLIIGARLGVPPARLRWTRGPHGKPALADPPDGVQVSLSHSGRLAVLALAGRRRVGVDLQWLPAAVDPTRMATRYYPAGEAGWVTLAGSADERARRFGQLWARKEACVKVAGGRLVPGLRLAVRGTDDDGTIVSDPGGVLPGPYLVRDLPAPRGFHAAVALDGVAPYRVVSHRWPGDRIPLETPMAVDTCSTVPSKP
jgi:4'-phosphopantetheinyl transferase